MAKEFPKTVYVYWHSEGDEEDTDGWFNICTDEREATESHGKWNLVGKYELKSVSEIMTVTQLPKIKRRTPPKK